VRVFEWKPLLSSAAADARVLGMKPQRSGQVNVAIRNVDTEGLVDGKRVRLPGAYEVKEARTFETVLGGSATLFVLEPIDLPAPPKEKPKPARKTTTEEKNNLRMWTDASGQHTVKATFVEFADNKVVLRREDGRLVRLSALRLSKADQEYFRQQLRQRRKQ